MAAPVPPPRLEAGLGSRGAFSRRDFVKLSGGVSAALGTLGALGMSLAPPVAHARTLRIQNARAVPTICPYCAVGCGMIAHTINGQIVNIEGNPDSPVSEGNLCPKGAASYQLAVNEKRWTTVKYRAAELRPLGGSSARLGDGSHRPADQANARRKRSRKSPATARR